MILARILFILAVFALVFGLIAFWWEDICKDIAWTWGAVVLVMAFILFIISHL